MDDNVKTQQYNNTYQLTTKNEQNTMKTNKHRLKPLRNAVVFQFQYSVGRITKSG
jgi:hypothetical protein